MPQAGAGIEPAAPTEAEADAAPAPVAAIDGYATAGAAPSGGAEVASATGAVPELGAQSAEPADQAEHSGSADQEATTGATTTTGAPAPDDSAAYAAWKAATYSASTPEPAGAPGVAEGVQQPLAMSGSNLMYNEYIAAYVRSNGKFTMGTTGGNPSIQTDDNKLLLYGHPGSETSETLIRVNGSDQYFFASGTQFNDAGTSATSSGSVNGIDVTQILSFEYNSYTRLYDTVSIKYVLANNSDVTKDVGARIMLDTMLGINDGAPFRIAGYGEVTSEVEFSGDDIPAGWEAFDSLVEPSVYAMGTFYRSAHERPDKVQFAAWPRIRSSAWDFAVSGGTPITSDSAVAAYFDPVTIAPGSSRTIITYYGISAFAGGTGSGGDSIGADNGVDLRVSVSAPTEMIANSIDGGYYSNPFSITGYFTNYGAEPLVNATVTLTLPRQIQAVSAVSRQIGTLAPGQSVMLSWDVMALPSSIAANASFRFEVSSAQLSRTSAAYSILLNKEGAAKLPVIMLHGIFGSTAKSNDIPGFHPIRNLYPNMPKQMPAPQSSLKIYDNYSIVSGDTGYQDFVNKLKGKGYKAYVCVYDWRLSLADIVANRYLQDVIDTAKSDSGSDKVIVVAHSLGGLVARQYIQSSAYRGDIEAFFMVGTPNNGSAFTYPILDGGIVIDDDALKQEVVTSGATYNIMQNILEVMAPGTAINPRNIFDFLRKKVNGKYRVASIMALNSQNGTLLGKERSAGDYSWSNPYVNHPLFPSETAALNVPGAWYQPLAGNRAGLVRTGVLYADDILTITDFLVKDTTVSPRFPNGEIVTTQTGGGIFGIGSYTKAQVFHGDGDGTVAANSARLTGSQGTNWSLIPLRYSNRHADLVDDAAGGLLLHYAFTDSKIDLSAGTVLAMKSSAESGNYGTMSALSGAAEPDATDEESSGYGDDAGEDGDSGETGGDPWVSINIMGPEGTKYNVTDSEGRIDGYDGGVGEFAENIPVSAYTDYGYGQSVVDIGNPQEESAYTVNIFPNNGGYAADGQTVAVIVTYCRSDAEPTSEVFQLNIKENTQLKFYLRADGSILADSRVFLDSYHFGGYTILKWEAVPDAESYNVYIADSEGQLTLVGSVGGTEATLFYETGVPWLADDNAYYNGDETVFYVEPTYAGNVAGLISNRAINYDYTYADFGADVDASSPTETTVTFANASFGVIDTWVWDFGDGSEPEEGANPIHTYGSNVNGTVYVTLHVSGPSGFSSMTKPINIGVHLTSIELAPANARLRVGDSLQITATAHYSDGTQFDVTRDERLELLSSEPSVAAVDGDNRIIALRHGHFALNAYYGSLSAAAVYTVTDTLS
ncbi:MAG: hypothetical protein LBJ10_06570 [Clostridiales bacterium]|nr:hypothetical protein [Clostridiales bacterium]